MTNPLQDILDETTRVQQEAKETFKNHLKKIFETFWERNPEIVAVSWSQHGPNNNDGDPSPGGVNDVFMSKKQPTAEDFEEGLGYVLEEMEESFYRSDPEWNEDCKILTRFIESREFYPVLWEMFDSSYVYCDRSGIKEEEYDAY